MDQSVHAGFGSAAACATRTSTRLFPKLPLALASALGLLVLFPPIAGQPRLVATFVGVALGLVVWTAWLHFSAKRSGRTLAVELARPLKSHYVQGCVQLSIYAYWGWYWPKVYDAAPLILGQMLFLFAFDGLLTLSRGRNWRLGLGPVPVIFSTNLFLWFKDDWFVFQFAMIASCALAKEFIRWERDGKNTHIFNPSAFGLSICSLILIATGTTHLTWGIEVANTLGWAPHMYVWIFVVGLIVQYLFSVTLMTLSAVAVLYVGNLIYTQTTGVYHFVDTNIPIAIFLGLHLLVTDPATSPKTTLGRVIFGGLYGGANFVLFSWLGHLGLPDFYDKLLPVPLLNLSVRALDAFARLDVVERFTRWEHRFQPRRSNLVYMGAWSALFGTMFATGFVEAPHPGGTVAFWRSAYEQGKPAAGRNWMKMVGSRADLGDPAACNQLGMIYLEGEIVPQNRGAAAHYFARACELGNPRGCENVARQFLTWGEAISPQVVQRAFDQLEQRPLPGQAARATTLVGRAYELGRGRPQDRGRAWACYAASARVGELDGAKGLVRLWLGGSPAGDELALAAPLLERAPDAESAYLLARQLRAGAGVPADEARARALIERACGLGVAEACAELTQSSTAAK
ncbi:MAG: sel1 repeat family protein [Planctomycetes bacterium]|nr:sel1 repeat family protein [Planctomycetota bacterium]